MRVNLYIAVAALGVVLMLAGDRRRWTLPAAGEPFRVYFEAAAASYGVPAALLERMAQQESSFNPNAYNDGSGAAGLMQLIPRFYPGVDPFNPAQAIPAAAESIRRYYDHFGSWSLALAAYNWGPGNLGDALAADEGRDAWPRETRDYVAEITADTGLV